ncbi:hypothetical protein Dimus_032706 [Dionaea muscipula]
MKVLSPPPGGCSAVAKRLARRREVTEDGGFKHEGAATTGSRVAHRVRRAVVASRKEWLPLREAPAAREVPARRTCEDTHAWPRGAHVDERVHVAFIWGEQAKRPLVAWKDLYLPKDEGAILVSSDQYHLNSTFLTKNSWTYSNVKVNHYGQDGLIKLTCTESNLGSAT